MKFSTLLQCEHIVRGLEGPTIERAAPELLARVESFKPNLSLDAIADGVIRREKLSTTALALGVAVPHARLPDLKDFYILCGLAKEPFKDKCVDGTPVDIVFMILANDQKNTLMLQSLAAISQLAETPGSLKAMREAQSAEEIWAVIDAARIEVKRVLQAADLMKRSYVRAHSEMALRDLLDLMFELDASEVVVLTPDERIVGSVSSAEIIEAGFPDYMARMRDLAFLNEFEPFEQFFKKEAKTKVEDIMNRNPLIVEAGDPMIQVVFRMRQQRERFAFVQQQGKFVGTIDRNDIISKILRA